MANFEAFRWNFSLSTNSEIGRSDQQSWKKLDVFFFNQILFNLPNIFYNCKNLLDNTSWNKIDSRTTVTAWVLCILDAAILAPGTNLKFLKCINFDKLFFRITASQNLSKKGSDSSSDWHEIDQRFEFFDSIYAFHGCVPCPEYIVVWREIVIIQTK